MADELVEWVGEPGGMGSIEISCEAPSTGTLSAGWYVLELVAADSGVEFDLNVRRRVEMAASARAEQVVAVVERVVTMRAIAATWTTSPPARRICRCCRKRRRWMYLAACCRTLVWTATAVMAMPVAVVPCCLPSTRHQRRRPHRGTGATPVTRLPAC